MIDTNDPLISISENDDEQDGSSSVPFLHESDIRRRNDEREHLGGADTPRLPKKRRSKRTPPKAGG